MRRDWPLANMSSRRAARALPSPSSARGGSPRHPRCHHGTRSARSAPPCPRAGRPQAPKSPCCCGHHGRGPLPRASNDRLEAVDVLNGRGRLRGRPFANTLSKGSELSSSTDLGAPDRARRQSRRRSARRRPWPLPKRGSCACRRAVGPSAACGAATPPTSDSRLPCASARGTCRARQA